jgi:hypothetical protein
VFPDFSTRNLARPLAANQRLIPNSKFRIPNSRRQEIFAAREESERQRSRRVSVVSVFKRA